MTFVKKLATGLIVLVLSAAGLSACHRTPDEAQVRQAIGAMAEAAEAGSAKGLVAPVSADFDGNGGALDVQSLSNMMRLLSLRGEHVSVVTGPVTIERRGERIVARFALTLTSDSHLLPDQWGVYKVESAWRREDGRWRCYAASWKRAM